MDSYNDIADQYEAYGKEAITDIEIGYKNVLRLLGDVRGKKILDYGCGVGKFSRILKDLGADVVGVDIAESELAIAKNKNSDIEFHTISEWKRWGAKDYDLAVLNYVITAIPSTETIHVIFHDIHDSLRPAGKLVMMNSNYEESAGRRFLTFGIGEVKRQIGAPLQVLLGRNYDFVITDYYYSKDFYTSALDRAGFRVEAISEPLADTQDHQWKDEISHPPFVIISAVSVPEGS